MPYPTSSLAYKVNSANSSPAETVTTSFNEIISGNAIFGHIGKIIFSIPFFQRTYIWKTDLNVKGLVESILNVRDFDWTEVDYFQIKKLVNKSMPVLGVLTLQESTHLGENTVTVIDGQQRVTTLIILAACVINELKKSKVKSCEDMLDYTEHFVKSLVHKNKAPGSFGSSTITPCWQMNNGDSEFINKMLLALQDNTFDTIAVSKGAPPIQMAFKKCKEIVFESFKNWKAKSVQLQSYDGTLIPVEFERAEYYYRMLNRIFYGVNFSVCLYCNDRNGSELYNDLNNKGKKMAHHENIRNMLLYQLLGGRVTPQMDSAQKIQVEKDLANSWDFIYNTIGGGNNLDSFLHDILRVQLGHFASGNILIKWEDFNRVNDKVRVESLMSNLLEYAKAYSLFISPPKNYTFNTEDFPQRIRGFKTLKNSFENLIASKSMGIERASSPVTLFVLMFGSEEELSSYSKELVSLAVGTLIEKLDSTMVSSPLIARIMESTITTCSQNISLIKSGELSVTSVLRKTVLKLYPATLNYENLINKLSSADLGESLTQSMRTLLVKFFNSKMESEYHRRGDYTVCAPVLNAGTKMNFEHLVPIAAPISHPAYLVRQTIGNLFPMDAYKNQSQRDITFDKKYNHYASCLLQTTKSLSIKALKEQKKYGFISEPSYAFIKNRSIGLASAIIKKLVLVEPETIKPQFKNLIKKTNGNNKVVFSVNVDSANVNNPQLVESV